MPPPGYNSFPSTNTPLTESNDFTLAISLMVCSYSITAQSRWRRRRSPKNRCHGQANHSHCCLVLGCLLVESPRPRIYRIRGNRCTNSTAKSIGFVSSVRSINRCNITLFCDNPRTSQQPLGIFATWKRFLYHFLAFLFSVFVHHHLHNSSNFAAKIHLFPNTASLYITFLAWPFSLHHSHRHIMPR